FLHPPLVGGVVECQPYRTRGAADRSTLDRGVGVLADQVPEQCAADDHSNATGDLLIRRQGSVAGSGAPGEQEHSRDGAQQDAVSHVHGSISPDLKSLLSAGATPGSKSIAGQVSRPPASPHCRTLHPPGHRSVWSSST